MISSTYHLIRWL